MPITELERRLLEAVNRLESHYKEREQQLDQELANLTALVERLAKHVTNSNTYVSSVAAGLTRAQDQQLNGLVGQVEHLVKLVNNLSSNVSVLNAQLKRLQGG